MDSKLMRRLGESSLTDKRSKISCSRCISKKRKCDGDFITNRPCTICKKRNMTCHYNPRRSSHYVNQLEEKIRYLESLRTVPQTSHFGTDSAIILNLAYERNQQRDIDEEKLSIQLNYEADQYFKNYFSSIHDRYPFIPKKHLQKLHEERKRLFNVKEYKPVPSISSLINTPEENEATYGPVNKFMLAMIYAIGSRRPCSVFYDYAVSTQDVESFSTDHDLTRIHCLLLLVIYEAQFNDPRIWKIISLAAVQCLHLNYHKRNLNILMTDPLCYFNINITFWCVFTLERILSNIYDKPYIFDIEDIEICLPLDLDESADEELVKEGFLQRYFQSPNESKSSSPLKLISSSIKSTLTQRTNLSTSILHLKLRIIEGNINSNIYKSINSVKNGVGKEDIYEKLYPIINSTYSELLTWKEELPSYLKKDEIDYWLYMYDKQIRYLFQPFLTHMTGLNDHFQVCIASSISILNYSKKFHGKNSGRITLISLQTVFLSGLNLVYSILSKKCSWSSKISEGLRNCTAFLVLLSERFKSCENFSSIFDNLLDEAISSPVANEKDIVGSLDNCVTDGESFTEEVEALKKFPVQFFGYSSPDFKVNSIPSVDLMFGQNTKNQNELADDTKAREEKGPEEQFESFSNIDSLFKIDELIQKFPDLDSFTFDLGIQ